MQIKFTTEAFIIYCAIALYLSAFVIHTAGVKKLSIPTFFSAFIVTLMAYIFHTVSIAQIPLQSLYEVFLFLAVIIYPLSCFCKKYLNANLQQGDMLIAVIILIPCGFVFKSTPSPTALQSPFFIPHVASYMLSYFIMTKAAILALHRLLNSKTPNILQSEPIEYNLVRFSFPLMTLALILGSIWAKTAWGRFWGWDPKECWALATWLIYVGYFYHRHTYNQKHPKTSGVWLIAGLIFIVITLVWVNLSRLFTSIHSYAT